MRAALDAAVPGPRPALAEIAAALGPVVVAGGGPVASERSERRRRRA
jgi:hypothetical protein